MNLFEESVKRQQFRNILISMAKYQFKPTDKKQKADLYKQLENLYHPNNTAEQYRHFYTDIFSVFSQLESGELDGTAEIVCLNIETIRKGYRVLNVDESGNPIDISENLKKLYDHASLEMARLNYAKSSTRENAQEAIRAEYGRKVNSFQSRLENLSASVTAKIDKSAQNAKKEYIAILSIFAAVLMVFFSGVGFSSAVLANIHNASIYRIMMGIVLLGMILFDIIWVLLEFIKEIVGTGEKNRRPFYIANAIAAILAGTIFLIWVGEKLKWWTPFE